MPDHTAAATDSTSAFDAAPAPLKTKALSPTFANEQNDASNFRPGFDSLTELLGNSQRKVTGVKTRYFSEEEQARRTLQVKDGLLTRSGELLDTTESSGNGTARGEGAGRDIFVMTPEGEMRSSAAWENHQELEDPAQPTPEQKKSRFRNPFKKPAPAPPQNTVLSMINHSSLAAVADEETGGRKGGSVAAAGELKVERGKLQEISDASGHYKPDNEMMYQAIDKLAAGDGESEGSKVDMHDVSMKLTAKDRDKEKNLYASVREFAGYEGGMSAERAMRDRREHMKVDLRREVLKREKAKRGGAVPDYLPEEPEIDAKLENETADYGKPIPRAESGAADAKVAPYGKMIPRAESAAADAEASPYGTQVIPRAESGAADAEVAPYGPRVIPRGESGAADADIAPYGRMIRRVPPVPSDRSGYAATESKLDAANEVDEKATASALAAEPFVGLF